MYKNITPSMVLDIKLSNFLFTPTITTIRSTGGKRSNYCPKCNSLVIGFDAVEYLHENGSCYSCGGASK